MRASLMKMDDPAKLEYESPHHRGSAHGEPRHWTDVFDDPTAVAMMVFVLGAMAAGVLFLLLMWYSRFSY